MPPPRNHNISQAREVPRSKDSARDQDQKFDLKRALITPIRRSGKGNLVCFVPDL